MDYKINDKTEVEAAVNDRDAVERAVNDREEVEESIPYTPPEIPTNGLLARFEYGRKLYEDAAGTNDTETEDGVYVWKDMTGGYTAEQSASGKRPTDTGTEILGDGADDELRLNNDGSPLLSETGDWEVVLIGRLNELEQNNDVGIFLAQYGGTSNNGRLQISYSDSDFRSDLELYIGDYDGSNNLLLEINNNPGTTPWMASVQRSGDVFTTYNELTQNATDTASGATIDQTENAILGYGPARDSSYVDGAIRGLYIYDRPLTDDEREQLRDYAVSQGWL